MKTLITGAFRRITLRVALLLFIGDAVLVALFGAWLQIPDSHAWQFAFAMLCALLLIAAFLSQHAYILRSIRGVSTSLWISVVTLIPWAFLWWKLTDLSGHIAKDAWQRAGYWNSKLSPAMRHFFTYPRMHALQMDLITALCLFVIPAILLPFIIETATQGPRGPSWLAALKTLARWQHWLALALIPVAGYWVTTRILEWHPAASPWVEVFSLILRAGCTAVIDAALLLLLLAIDAELLQASGRAATADPAPDSL